MPGGAPLRTTSSSKRPCKYGPRVEGLCPKKPKSSAAKASSSGSASKKKAPCKYGPRTADGLCPKKPKAAPKGPSVKKLKSVSGAANQAGQVLRSDKATTQQKTEAVKVLGAAVAAESGKKVVEHIAKEARKQIAKPSTRKAAVNLAKKTAGAVKAVGTATAIGATLAIGGAALDAQRDREARKYADRELAATKKRLGGKITAEQAATLHQQYMDFYKKQPVQNPYLGK